MMAGSGRLTKKMERSDRLKINFEGVRFAGH